MGRRGTRNNVNPFAQKKRAKIQATAEGKPDRRSEPYQDIVRENENFIKYYKHLKICPDDEWELFLKYVRSNLPTTFRVTGTRGESQALIDIIKAEMFNDYLKGTAELKTDNPNEEEDNTIVKKPFCLPWYPNGLAWQLELSRKDIRRSEAFYKLHNFLIAETNAGSISRQEAVSMIPPIVLDVKPHHRVLDMCAAPGSKTSQLIEALHADSDIPTGFVVANDIDNNRCYMLVHQAKRLNSPCVLVTNHDSAVFPNMLTTTADGLREELRFDRILCDVPCSGDGTMRKNPDIWLKWNCGQGLSLHGIQYRIVRRGCELLKVGGRLVYSTCSFNPIENEAVLLRLLKECNGAMEIVDASNLLVGLKYHSGMENWEPATRDIQFFKKFEDVPEKYHTILRPQMFPSEDADEIQKYNINKCIRVLPHQQNTGGFFVAVLEKKCLLPWEQKIEPKIIVKTVVNDYNTTNNDESKNSNDEKQIAAPRGRKRRHLQGFREDPFVFFQQNEEIWHSLKNFYKLSDEFNPLCLLTRCLGGKKKNVYFCSEAVRDLILTNESFVKIINTGVKTFVRCDNRNMRCAFRLANEGLGSINHLIGTERRVNIIKDDLIMLLNNTIPTKPPMLNTLSQNTQDQVNGLTPGSCILKYSDDKLTISLVGWRGTESLRAYTDANDTIHMLRLLGADLSKYDINKFQKVKTIDDENDESGKAIDDDNEEFAKTIDDDNNKTESISSDAIVYISYNDWKSP